MRRANNRMVHLNSRAYGPDGEPDRTSGYVVSAGRLTLDRPQLSITGAILKFGLHRSSIVKLVGDRILSSAIKARKGEFGR